MSNPLGGEMLLNLRITRTGAEALPQTSAQIVQLNNVLRSTTGTIGTTTANLFQLNTAQQRVGVVARGGGRGLAVMRTALTGLAFQATGTAGPVGRLASGLLLFTGGSTLVLGVAAGIGVIAGAYQLLTKDAREAAAEHRKLIATLSERAATRAEALIPESGKIARDVTSAREQLAALTTQRAGLITRRGALERVLEQQRAVGAATGPTLDELVELNQQLQRIDEERAALSLDLVQNRRAAVPVAKQEADEAERALRAERDRLLLRRQSALERELLGPIPSTPIGGVLGAGKNLLKLEPAISPAFQPEKFAPREFFLQDLVKEAGKQRAAGPDAAALAAQSVALLGALRQGGAAGILGAGGGLLSGLSAITSLGGLGPVGIGLSALSGVVGLFDNSAEKHTQKIVDAINRMAKDVGLDRVTVVFTGPDGHQVRRTLATLEDSDAVERVPGPVGAQG